MGNVCSVSVDVSHCWESIAMRTRYVREVEENRDALKAALDKLKAQKDDVVTQVENDEAPLQMERLKRVQDWLSKVGVMETNVNNLIEEVDREIQNKCMSGCCLKNCISLYKLGKKVARKINSVDTLEVNGHFEQVTYSLPSAPMGERPSEPTVGLESTFNEVWSYIGDNKVGIIGLFGTGGVGKTTLLKQINNELCNTTHEFNIVFWVVVSQNLNLIKVQDDIAKKIGLQIHDSAWNNKDQDEKACDILKVLKKQKFALLLDDIWNRFDLLKMGIPIPNEQNKSKVIFTTRSKEVCGNMEAHKTIKVKFLAPDRAWDLFQQKVGEDTLNSHPEILELAKIVAKECQGLPLALITIGRAMACKKEPQEWHYASQVLKKCAAKFSEMEDEVFPLLKFSYDNLRDGTIKFCFLYCSLFPEDFSISRERLIDYWIAEGLLVGWDDLNEAIHEGHFIIGTLINAALLEVGVNSEFEVKMHDVIRDMALWIACECGKAENKFLVQAGTGLERALEVGKWKGVERMSLMNNIIKELTEKPLCPNLIALFLNNNCLRMISCAFFTNMPKLRVLDLSENIDLVDLPAGIGELISLQYLNLFATEIRKLPIELQKLVELKYLNLNTRSQLLIPDGILPNFNSLRVLNVGDVGRREENLVKEVGCLKSLSHLSITISTDFALSGIIRSPNLLSCIRLMLIQYFNGSKYIDISFLESMRCLNRLAFKLCMGLEALIVKKMASSEIRSHPCFHGLRSVEIYECPMLKEVTWLMFAPTLEFLSIQFCKRLEEVIVGGEAAGGERYLHLFANLQTLELAFMPQLKSICLSALPFPFLNSITVLGCPNLKKLPLNSNTAEGRKVVIKGEEYWWNEVEWEDEATRILFLTSFTCIEEVSEVIIKKKHERDT